jgi:hypothetical protein
MNPVMCDKCHRRPHARGQAWCSKCIKAKLKQLGLHDGRKIK